MNSIRRKAPLVAFAAPILLLAAACGPGDRAPGRGELSGTVSGDGSSTVFPITEAVAEEFQKKNPGVQVSVGVSGTGGGFKKFCAGETDVQNASRPIKNSEIQACRAASIEYLELTIASDGLAVVVNRANTWAECLTTEELKKIWGPDSAVMNWRSVRSGFPNKALKLYGPGTDSGTFDFFTGVIVGEEGASRTDYTASEDDNTLVQGVEGDEGALGYFGFAYYSENKDRLTVLGIDSGSGCVRPSDETVRSGKYQPLARPLFLYVKKSSLTRPEVRAIVEFYLEVVGDLLPDVGYTSLSDEALNREKEEFEQALSS